MDKTKFCFISSDCTTTLVYHVLQRPYDTPFIASLFEDDMQYLKFCLNYEYYMGIPPRFAPPLLKIFAADPAVPIEKVVVMFLGDIEIHWIHHADQDEVASEYQRRLERGKGQIPFFIWSDSQLYQPHTPEERESMVSQFLSLPTEQRVYYRKEDIPEWADQSWDSRQEVCGHIQPLTWLDMHSVCKRVLAL